MVGRESMVDQLYSNEKDDITIEIDPIEQDRKLKEAEANCTKKREQKSNRIY